MVTRDKAEQTDDGKRDFRDSKTGRFLVGNPGGGRLPKAPKSLVAALKERLDPEELAAELIKRSKRSDQLLMYIYDRIEGRPRQALEHTGENGGPIKMTWDDGSPAD